MCALLLHRNTISFIAIVYRLSRERRLHKYLVIEEDILHVIFKYCLQVL